MVKKTKQAKAQARAKATAKARAKSKARTKAFQKAVNRANSTAISPMWSTDSNVLASGTFNIKDMLLGDAMKDLLFGDVMRPKDNRFAAESSPDCYYLLKVELQHWPYPVWHRLVLHATDHFYRLQSKILSAMDFELDHLSSFFVGANTYDSRQEFCICTYEPGDFEPDYEIGQVLGTNKGMQLTLLYDFGDNWNFLITLEEILDSPEDLPADTVMHEGGHVDQYPSYDMD